MTYGRIGGYLKKDTMSALLRFVARFGFVLLLVLPFAPAIARAQDETAAQPAATPAEPAHHFVTVYGAKIHYIEAGDGPPLILLHGLGGSSGDWVLSVSMLSQKFRVIVPDQVGFGQSDKPFIRYRIGTYVDFLDRFLTELKVPRASLIGNSLGGWVAASYALAHPERVERLVLVDAAGFALPANFDMAQLKGLNPSTREGIRLLIGRAFYNAALFGSDDFLDSALTLRIRTGDGHTIDSLLDVIRNREESLDNRLGAVRQPTLILWGRQDGIVPVTDGERFQREIPGARLVVFEQCGHLPQVEKAFAFNTTVINFLLAPPK
jgi:triacylglycerol lipase